MGGKVLVSTAEHVDRLRAARLQCDIMGTETLVVARTDAEAACLLDSNIDPRDQWQILGTTNVELPRLSAAMGGADDGGGAAADAQEEWLRAAQLCTLSDAVGKELRAAGYGAE